MGSTNDTHDTTEQPGNGIGMDHLVGENIESKIMDDGVVSFGNGTGNATEKSRLMVRIQAATVSLPWLIQF